MSNQVASRRSASLGRDDVGGLSPSLGRSRLARRRRARGARRCLGLFRGTKSAPPPDDRDGWAPEYARRPAESDEHIAAAARRQPARRRRRRWRSSAAAQQTLKRGRRQSLRRKGAPRSSSALAPGSPRRPPRRQLGAFAEEVAALQATHSAELAALPAPTRERRLGVPHDAAAPPSVRRAAARRGEGARGRPRAPASAPVASPAAARRPSRRRRAAAREARGGGDAAGEAGGAAGGVARAGAKAPAMKQGARSRSQTSLEPRVAQAPTRRRRSASCGGRGPRADGAPRGRARRVGQERRHRPRRIW